MEITSRIYPESLAYASDSHYIHHSVTRMIFGESHCYLYIPFELF